MNVKFNYVNETLFNHYINLFPTWVELKKLPPYITQYKFLNPIFYITYNKTIEELDINGRYEDINYHVMLFEQTHYRFLKEEKTSKAYDKQLRETRFISIDKNLDTVCYQGLEFSDKPTLRHSSIDERIQISDNSLDKTKCSGQFPPRHYVLKQKRNKTNSSSSSNTNNEKLSVWDRY